MVKSQISVSGVQEKLGHRLGSFVIYQEIRTSIAKKPYILCNFRGGGGVGYGPRRILGFSAATADVCDFS